MIKTVTNEEEWWDVFRDVVKELKEQDAEYPESPRMPSSILFEAIHITEKIAGKLPESDDDIKEEIIV